MNNEVNKLIIVLHINMCVVQYDKFDVLDSTNDTKLDWG